MIEETRENVVLEKLAGIPENPHVAELDIIFNGVSDSVSDIDYLVRLTVPEFTSLCPETDQPDFGTIVVDYMPHEWLVESKSFKLFMHSFRNYGIFHEMCAMIIARKIINKVTPRWIRVSCYFNPRGGIPIDVFWQDNEPPKGLHIPPHDIPLYRGR